MSETVEYSFVDKGIHYQIQLSVQQSDTFSILLIDEDQPDRWEGLYNGQIISKLTTSAGNTKKIQIFYKMLQNAILGNSNEVSFTILSQRDINEMKNVSQSQTNDTNNSISQSIQNETRYFILEQHTEFDRVKYPLRLMNKPYSIEELKVMIRSLRSENKRLSGYEQSNSQREKVRNLEQQIYDLNGSIRQLAEEKDQTIESLKKKIADLEEKARTRNVSKIQNNNISRQKTIRYSSNNNSNSISKNSSLTKKKQMVPTIGRGTTTAKYKFNNSRASSASSSAAGSRKSSASNSRKSSAAGSRKSSSANSRNSSARSSASNSRPSSRNSFKRFNPTEWVQSHQRNSSANNSRNGSRNNSRNQSPSGYNSIDRNKGVAQNDTHIKRLRALVQKKYI